ncbi:MAG: ComF family protein [Ruminococcaceae bacterium]|nr:ComF family protein [Oscillospiraceae bacterium]
MRITEFLDRFVFTRKCVACSELLSYDMRREAFCDKCRAQWEKAKTEECARCGMAVCECSCMTKTLSESGAICHKKAVFYSSYKPIQHNLIMFLKHNSTPRVAGFVAGQLAHILKSDAELPQISSEDTVVTFVPRSRSAILKYGHDQSEMLAKELAERCELPFEVLLERKKGGKVQKKLNAKERAKNARKLYSLSVRDENVKGRTVVLVDDIVTTGASMAACVSPLVKAGARYVVCLSVATTELRK